MQNPFAGLVIKSVLLCYATWGSVVVFDLISCETKRPGECEPQRSELRGAATTIPGTLLAWMAESPINGKVIAKRTNRIAKNPEDEIS